MAAHGSNFIRLRLHFDYPPPAVVDCRMCWLLVDLNTSRVVADLESVIREKFDFSRGSILSLFIDDCYLPHTESIYVVRDNDSVRVKVDRLSHVNGGVSHLDETSDSGRKRRRPTEEDGPEENGVSTEFKKKKRKKAHEQSVENVKKPEPNNTGSTKSHEKSTEKKKKKKTKKEKNSTVTPTPDGSTKKRPLPVEQTVKNKKSQINNVSSSDSSSSSEEDEPPKKTAAQKSAPKTPSSTPAPSKTLSTSKPAQKKPAPPSSSSVSSSDEDTSVKPPPKTKPEAQKTLKPVQKKPAPPSSSSVSSSDEDKTVKPPLKTKPSAHTTPKAGRSNDKQTPVLRSSNAEQQQQQKQAPSQDQARASSSEDEIPFIIHKPVQQPGFGVRGQSSWRARGGRGKSWRGDPGERRKAEGATGGQNGSMELNRNGPKEPSYQTDSLTNTSVIFQNGAESAPKKDYSSMPLLAAPPKVGQRIAFKLLELTENYTPEVSEYKEGKIVSFDAATKQIELELHNASRAPVEPGKFDLVYENADGTETVEYAVSRDSRVTERWESLLEPRLII
ncbi:coilin [Nelusetta ayraudi]|uniref:coilin n=1 Tax=Nelusetta ayraudi TaxID=303726 RepID=UPI003F6E5C13